MCSYHGRRAPQSHLATLNQLRGRRLPLSGRIEGDIESGIKGGVEVGDPAAVTPHLQPPPKLRLPGWVVPALPGLSHRDGANALLSNRFGERWWWRRRRRLAELRPSLPHLDRGERLLSAVHDDDRAEGPRGRGVCGRVHVRTTTSSLVHSSVLLIFAM